MFNSYTLANRPLKVNLARPKEERSFGGGGYGDRRGGPGGGYGRGGPGGGKESPWTRQQRWSTQILEKEIPQDDPAGFFYSD